MSAVTQLTPASVARWALLTIMATVFLSPGANFVMSKFTPTGPTLGTPVGVWRTSSGGQIGKVDELGNLSMSGAITTKKATSCTALQTTSTGMIVCASGGGISFATAEGIYVNQRGDTMTGTLKMRNGAAITISGAILNATGSFRRSATFVLTGSGVSTSTGVNVFGDFEMGMVGTIKSAYATVSNVASNNLTTITPKFNGTNIMSTQITIDSGEKSVRTAANAPVVSAGSFTGGTILTFNVNAPATTPAKDLKVTLVFDVTNFPQ